MLVPDLIEQFSPQGLLNVAFDGGSAIMPGANLSQSCEKTPNLHDLLLTLYSCRKHAPALCLTQRQCDRDQRKQRERFL